MVKIWQPSGVIPMECSNWAESDRARVTAQVFYVGERDDTGPTFTAEDYVTLNLLGSLKVTDRLEVFGRIENVFDVDYEEIEAFAAPGVSAFAGVRYTF